MPLVDAGRIVGASFADAQHYDLSLRCALILCVLYGGSTNQMDVGLRVVCGLLIVVPTLLRQSIVWWLLAAIMIAGNLRSWATIDNHKYLIMYWIVASAVSLGAARPDEYLRTAARSMIVVVFGFATAWKLISGEYVNGHFLYWTFVTDSRLARLAGTLAGTGPEQIAVAREAMLYMVSIGRSNGAVPIFESQIVRSLTWLLSWAVLLGEAAVCLAHAWGSYRVRHGILMVFVCLTYFLLPVPGFGFVLTCLGLAQCEPADGTRRAAYCILFIIVQLITLPWQSLLP